MLWPRYALSVVFLAGALACTQFEAWSDNWTRLLGSVVGADETIVGRVARGNTVWLMTAGNVLIRIDLDARRHSRHPVVPLSPGEHVWGLATHDADGLWTLAGRSTLLLVSAEGRVLRRIALGDLHAGVFSGGGQLLYQLTDVAPGAPALAAGPPGAESRRPWSSLLIRPLPLPRAQAIALNLIACGASVTAAIPCWFPDQHIVTLTDGAGASRDLPLEGFSPVTAHALLTTDNPRRPILDAFVSAESELWVLGSGEAPAGTPAGRRGGWLLARYDDTGSLLKRSLLPEQTRLLLRVTAASVTVLTWNGSVVEVRP